MLAGLGVLCAALSSSGCGDASAPPAVCGQAGALPRFEPAACPRELVASSRTMRCGAVVVAERRAAGAAAAGAAQVAGCAPRLAVVVVEAQNPARAEPLLLLHGGPGGGFFGRLEPLLALIEPLSADRDVVIFDQRGVGASTPELACRSQDFNAWAQSKTIADAADLYALCQQFHRERGVAVEAYTTAASAHDVVDVATALGYDRVDLLGGSYGSRLGFAVMRKFPARVRAVVLDAVAPREVRLYEQQPAVSARVFETLFADCAADAACNARYPNLARRFGELRARLDASPVQLPLQVGSRPITLTLDGDQLASQLLAAFAEPELIGAAPAIIDGAVRGEMTLLSRLGERAYTSSRATSDLLHHRIQCSDEGPFDAAAAQRARAVEAQHPDYAALGAFDQQAAICEALDVTAAPAADRAPLASDIPTLLLGGRYDARTPPAWAEQAAKTLTKSRVQIFDAAGHSALHLPCAQQLAAATLRDANGPDPACVATQALPDFSVDAAALLAN